MTTQELILQELGTLNENELSEVYKFIRNFREPKPPASQPSLMSKLKRVKIYAPPDFAANLDLYLSGEKSVQPGID